MTEETATIEIVEATVDAAAEPPKPRRKRRKIPPEERAKRGTKADVKDDYQAHKTLATCEACSLNFGRPRAAAPHGSQRPLPVGADQRHCRPAQGQAPGAHDFVEEALRPELVRMQNVMSRSQGERPPKAAEPVNDAENKIEEKGRKEMQN